MAEVETWIAVQRSQVGDYRIAPNQGVVETVGVRNGQRVHRDLGELSTHLTGINPDPDAWLVARVCADDKNFSAADQLGFHDVLTYVPAITDFIPLGNAVSRYSTMHKVKLVVEKR